MKRQISACAALMMLSLSVSAPVFADDQAVANTGVCANLSTLQQQTDQQLQKRIDTQASRYQKNSDKRTENRTEWDQKREEARKKWDDTRSSNIQKLDQKAKSSAQKAAVAAYKTALLAAIEARRAAYDTARSDFRSAVDKVFVDHNALLLAQIKQFKTDSDAAYSKAELACKSSDVNQTAVREALLSDLKAARQKYLDAKQANPKIGEQISALAHKRHDAQKAADQAFENAREAARVALKKALKEASFAKQDDTAKKVMDVVKTKKKSRVEVPSTSSSSDDSATSTPTSTADN